MLRGQKTQQRVCRAQILRQALDPLMERIIETKAMHLRLKLYERYRSWKCLCVQSRFNRLFELPVTADLRRLVG